MSAVPAFEGDEGAHAAHTEQQEQAMGHGSGDVRRASVAKRRECQLDVAEGFVHRITAQKLLDAELALRELSLANSPPKLRAKEPGGKQATHQLQGAIAMSVQNLHFDKMASLSMLPMCDLNVYLHVDQVTQQHTFGRVTHVRPDAS